jgi:paraquat-inducible protein B
MGRKANPTVIGAFIVGAVVLIVAALMVFGSGTLFTRKHAFVLYFDGSVNGLNVGAPVKFRGVKVGAVTLNPSSSAQDHSYSVL